MDISTLKAVIFIFLKKKISLNPSKKQSTYHKQSQRLYLTQKPSLYTQTGFSFFIKLKKCVEKYKKCDIIIIGDSNG